MSNNSKDLIGKQFGRLTVLERDYEYPIEHHIKSKQAYWKCQCNCGNIKTLAQQSLTSGITQSCGCLSKELSVKRQKKDLTGQIFNRLTVIKEATKKDNNHHTIWHCKCICGNECDIASDKLMSGNTQSCGCLSLETLKRGRENNPNRAKDILGQKFGYLTAIKSTEDRYFGSVVWLCQCECGNYINVPQNHLNNNTWSCGCLSSKGEANIQNILEQNNIKFEKQKTFGDLKSNNKNFYRYDFYLPEYNRLIEFDGEQHFSYSNSGWNNKENFEKTQQSDQIKNEYAKSHNIPLVRIPYWERNSITLNMLINDFYLID